MGLAASQARLLTLTSDKMYLEKQIAINTNRKMALTAEMSRLAYQKNSKLNSFQYQVSTLDGGMREINYEYLMGRPGGVQNISTKSEDKMMLFDSASGKVILSEDMANIIGPIQDLRNNQNQKYEAIARLCGDAHLTKPSDVPSNIDLKFCADPELVRDICNGMYNSYSLNDLTRAISRYNLYSYATNNDGACGNLIPAQQNYINPSSVYPYINSVEWVYGVPNIIGDKYITLLQLGATGTSCYFSWAHAYQISSDRGVNYYDPDGADYDSQHLVSHDVNNALVNFGTLSNNSQTSMKSKLTSIVKSLANVYARHTDCKSSDFNNAITQTVNEFMSNYNPSNNSLLSEQSTQTKRIAYLTDEDGIVSQGDFYSSIDYRTLTSGSNNDSDRLTFYLASNYPDKYDMYIDVSALATYFHAALLGEGIGYLSQEGPDEFLFSTNNAGSSADGGATPVPFPDEFADSDHWKSHGIQQFVPAGQNTEQWLSSFNKLINDVKFYYPIVDACIKFGYTTKYDDYINEDPSYVDESLQNGTFQIMDFDAKNGDLDGSHNTKYYLMFSEIFKMDDESQKLEVQAWYQKEKSSIKHKEDVLDTMISQMDTELNSINTEIESIKSLIDDSKKKFEWCTSS